MTTQSQSAPQEVSKWETPTHITARSKAAAREFCIETSQAESTQERLEAIIQRVIMQAQVGVASAMIIDNATLRQTVARLTQERDEAREGQRWALAERDRAEKEKQASYEHFKTVQGEYDQWRARIKVEHDTTVTKLTAAESELAALRIDRERTTEAMRNAERYLVEHGCSHEYPVLINLRAAIDAARNQQEGRE